MANYSKINEMASQDVYFKLSRIIDVNQYPGCSKTQALKIVAQKLLKQSYPCKEFTWNYIHQVQSKKLRSSARLSVAINREFQKTINQQDIEYEIREVLAPIGFLLNHTYIMTKSRICLFCQRPFLPVVANQLFCSKSCRNSHRSKKRVGKYGKNL